MSSSAFPHRIRLLIVVCLAVGMVCSGFSARLARGDEAAFAAADASSAPTCCCGLDGNCGMGCCVVQAPVAPDSPPVPVSRSSDRAPSVFVLDSESGLPTSGAGSVPHARHALQAAHLITEPSLQRLQVRLDI